MRKLAPPNWRRNYTLKRVFISHGLTQKNTDE